MADVGLSRITPRKSKGQWLTRLLASPDFHRKMARIPLLRRIVRSEGEAMFDLVAGFCHSQILMALVKLDIPNLLLDAPRTRDDLSHRCAVPPERMSVLLNGAQAIGLIKQRGGIVRLTSRGAALAGVPGLQGMIAHHDVLYRDLADPVAFFRGEVETELAAFWPYVFGATGASDPETAQRYSALMADSQALVAEDTLAAVSFSGVSNLMDIGGGSGAFLAAAGQKEASLHLTLFDLPAVVPAAISRFVTAGLDKRATIVPGSFRDDPLPIGADMISLVRVLYDHSDDTVRQLLGDVHGALPKGGRVLISEPMTGGEAPQRAGDAYFALYCMAMRTGQARSPDRIIELLSEAGFSSVKKHPSRRPFITTVIEAVRST